MKKKKVSVSLLFTLLFVVGANAQEAATQTADPYNTVKSLAVLALMVLALVVLYYKSQRKPVKQQADAPAVQVTNDKAVPDEVVAAIAMTLNGLQEEVHDKDNLILTLRNGTHNYSPWNSKIVGLKQIPLRK